VTLTGLELPKASFTWDAITSTARAGNNVSSISDTGVGVFSANYTNSFADILQAAVCGTDEQAAGTSIVTMNCNEGGLLTGLSGWETARMNAVTDRTNLDCRHNGGETYGDLA
jgi:hypothetical protein